MMLLLLIGVGVWFAVAFLYGLVMHRALRAQGVILSDERQLRAVAAVECRVE